MPNRPAPAILLLAAAAACAAVVVAIAPAGRVSLTAFASGASSPTPTPPPTPTPVNAFLSLDVTAGGPTTQVTVSGGAFLANEQMTLYWDPPTNKVAGGANADSSGNFTTHVRPFAGDAPGIHHLCASVAPFPCANFTLQAATPTPSPSPSPSPGPTGASTPSPTTTPTGTASPTRAAATINGLDVILKPPFVILPIIGALGLLVAIGYLALSIVMRPRQTTLKSVAVSHLATRPDYAAGFGTPPPTPVAPAPIPSAWPDVVPPSPPSVSPAAGPEVPPPLPAFESRVPQSPGPVGLPPSPDPGERPPPPPVPDEPPDLPEPSDY